ncbi:MAG TPA: methyltransferase [Allosphingosinicella sp.]|nr:methyltransferase [Allosphingosinicella sp.]
MRDGPTPDSIFQIGMGFWASKTLLSAVELDLFTALGSEPKTGAELERALGLHPRATWDFLDALVALGLLERAGDGPAARYANTPATAAYLDRQSPLYVGGLLEMANARLYRFWADLTPALQTGRPQNEIKHQGKPMFAELYADPQRLEQFMGAMAGASMGNFHALAEGFDFSHIRTLADIGGAAARLSITVARRHPHLQCLSCDLPIVRPIAERHIEEAGLDGRVTAVALDFLADEFPKADAIAMSLILHDWDLDRKKMLIAKAFRALPEGGALIVVENLIDDERRRNAFGLLMSLNMLIEFGEAAFDFTGADFAGWAGEAGFSRCEILPLAGPASAAIAWK